MTTMGNKRSLFPLAALHSGLAMLLTMAAPFCGYTAAPDLSTPLQIKVTGAGEQRTTTYFPYAITAVLMAAAATLAGLSITKFENRITQIKLGTLNSLVLALVMVSIVVFFNPLAKQFPNGRMGLNLWGTFAAVAFNWVSLRMIRKDEKMVRDSDRLR